MFGIVENIRGLASSVVRAAVRIGRTAVETFGTLVESGLGYNRDLFALDYETFDVQSGLIDEIYRRTPRALIAGELHQKTDIGLKTKYRYDIGSTWLDAKGEEKEIFRTVSSEVRMTVNAIEEEAETWPEDYEEEGWQRATGWDIVGSFTKI